MLTTHDALSLSRPLSEMKHSTVTRNDTPAAAPGSTALAPVPESDSEKLTVIEAAQLCEISPQSMYRAVRSGLVPARKRGGSLTIMRDVVVQLAPVLRRQAPAGHRDRQREDGETARDAFKRFAAGETLVDVVENMALDPDTCERLFDRWLALQAKHRTAARAVCECGAPPDVRTARCLRCHTRTRVLSEADQALLAGREPPAPTSCKCAACGGSVDVVQAEHLCHACAPHLRVRVHGGVIQIVMGDVVLRQASIAETRDVALAVAHLLPPAAPIVPEPPPAKPDPTVAKLVETMNGVLGR